MIIVNKLKNMVYNICFQKKKVMLYIYPEKEIILCDDCLKSVLDEFTRYHAKKANRLTICSSCSGYIKEYEHYYTSDKQDIVLDIYFEGKICVGCWDTFIDKFYRCHIL